jgi:hypothetical protein
MKKKNEKDDPKYKTESGEPIEHTSDSLYDEVTLYFSRIETFFEIMEGFGTTSDVHKDPESYFYSFADLGRTVLRDIEQKFDRVFDFIVKEVGDIRIDAASYGQDGIKGDTLLGAYIEKKETGPTVGARG